MELFENTSYFAIMSVLDYDDVGKQRQAAKKVPVQLRTRRRESKLFESSASSTRFVSAISFSLPRATVDAPPRRKVPSPAAQQDRERRARRASLLAPPLPQVACADRNEEGVVLVCFV